MDSVVGVRVEELTLQVELYHTDDNLLVLERNPCLSCGNASLGYFFARADSQGVENTAQFTFRRPSPRCNAQVS